MKEKIPVTPEVLEWARLTMGLTIEEVARKMGKDFDTIADWGMGRGTPMKICVSSKKCSVSNLDQPISGSRTLSRKLKASALSIRPSMTFCTCANFTNKWTKRF